MEYEIIVADDLLKLRSKVRKFCGFGWEPQGGVFLDPRTQLYCQPAVRDIEDGKKEN